MYRTTIHLKRILLIVGDLLALQLALWLTLVLRYQMLTPSTWGLHLAPFTIISFFWAISLYVIGLYDLSKARNSILYFRTFLEGMIMNLLVAFAFFYLFPFFGIEPRTNLLLFFALSLFLIYSWRLIFNRFIAKELFKTRLLYIGPANDAIELRDLVRNSTHGFELVTVINTTPNLSREADGIHWANELQNLAQLIQEDRINGVVLGQELDRNPYLQDALYRSLYTSVAMIDRKELEETLTGRIPITNVERTWFLRHLKESEKTIFESTKRGLDVLTAIPFAILSLLALPFIALAIKLSSPGPIFYTQNRIGKHGALFRIIKFRTMRQDAEKDGAKFAQKDDPRITKVGKFLRRTRLDELPQIWNVLMGDMSFVGPRPERPEFVVELQNQMPYYALRHLTRPGLTGWAQVRFTYASTIEDNLKKLQYDLYYVKHRSLVLDAAIMLKTINIVLRREGT